MRKKNIFQFYVMLVGFLLLPYIVFAQGYIPIRGMGTEAKSVNSSGICLACYNGSLNPLVDADLNNKVSMGSFATLASGNGISIKNTVTTYPAGYITGFNIDTGTSFITAELLSSLRISTYKTGDLQETSTSSTLVSVPAFGGTKSRIFLHFKSTKAFDEVRLYQTNVLSLFSAMNVYYAFAFDPAKMIQENNGICDDIIAGSSVDGNVSGSSQFIAPLSYVANREKISDGDKNSYGSIVLPAGLLGSYSVGLLDKDQIYPAGNRAGFVISPDDEGKLLSAEFLKNVTIETYLFGQLQDSRMLSDGGGLINIKVLGFGSGKQKISLTTTKPFNEIRLKVTQTIGVNVGALKVYYAFEEPLSCDCDDKIQTSGSSVSGSLQTGSSWTSGQGLLGILLSKMTNPENIIDTNTSNYATATVPAISFLGVFSAYATAKTTSLQPANTFAGFTLEKAANLAGVSILQNISVVLYNNDAQTDVFIGAGSLFSGNFFTTDSNKFYVGGKATKPFNRIKILFYSGTGISFPQNYYIYNVFSSKDSDNDGVPDCYDLCSNGNDGIDTNGNGVPDCAEGCSVSDSDKSTAVDTDKDGVTDACDLDSDNDGILDSLEDSNKNGIFEDDDTDGDELYSLILGDGIASYKDLDSDNDGVLDLFESGIPRSIIDQIDKDYNGIIDLDVSVGKNGFADILETYPDSGIPKYPLIDVDGDNLANYLDLTSNGVDYDLYSIGKDSLDMTGFGFIMRTSDLDGDGIQDFVDTSLVNRGAPGSILPPYLTASQLTSKLIPLEVAAVEDVKVYPNPIKSGETLYIQSSRDDLELQYYIYSAQGQILRSGKFLGNGMVDTSSLTAGVYVLKTQSGKTTKSYKIIVQ